MMARPCQRALCVLALFLVTLSALVAASDDCGALASDRHCPFCRLANLPVTPPAQAPRLALPEMVEWYDKGHNLDSAHRPLMLTVWRMRSKLPPMSRESLSLLPLREAIDLFPTAAPS